MNGELVLFDDSDASRDSAKNRIVPSGYKSADIVDILQPKTVTYAKYRFSSKMYYRLLAHIREELTAYIDNDFNHLEPGRLIRIPVFCSHYPHFNGKIKEFRKFIEGMMKSECNLVSFRWRFDASRHADMYRWMMMQDKNADPRRIALPKDGADFSAMSFIIVNYMLCDDTNVLLVDINPMMLPFLLYYGVGNGGTCFNRDVYLKLDSVYSFRLYEFIMDWSTSTPVRKMSLEELQSFLAYPSSYNITNIKKYVLDAAKADMEAAGSNVSFDYELKYDSEFGFAGGTRGSLPANCVVFYVKKKEYVDLKELSRKRILLLLQSVAEREKQHLCSALAKTVVENGKDYLLNRKFDFYNKKVQDGKMCSSEFNNTMLKIIREVTGVDLRSGVHIRNSARAKRRTTNEPKLLFNE